MLSKFTQVAKMLIKRGLAVTGYTVTRLTQPDETSAAIEVLYDEDGLRSVHDHSFHSHDDFRRAYNRGILAAGDDYHWKWRVHVGLWAASHAVGLEGDFVECGVNRGFLSSAIMEYLNWNERAKQFFLLDTFSGIDERFISDSERSNGILSRNERGFYAQGSDAIRANFAEWDRVRIIEGAVPETLPQVDSSAIAFLHLDMNCSIPEVAALEYFWEHLVDGGIVLLDDYAYKGYGSQKAAMDVCASKIGVPILSLPTGQGVLLKRKELPNVPD